MIQGNAADKKSASEIEELILAEADFARKIDIYVQHYSLVKNSGRLTTNGHLSTKFFCVCNNCQKKPNYSENLAVYNGYLEKELKQIISTLNGFTDYEQKLKFYATNFDINCTYLYEDLSITISIEPLNEYENKVFDESQYSCSMEYFM